tara:strand:- start:607 stop:1596 length:990 start_codon:yes stop_codon:yes gene_type:complete
MTSPVNLVEIWRNDLLESAHQGHAVVCDEHGEIVQAWGDPSAVIFPRSSCKMIQALPLLESGAGADLTTEQLALSCASHQGAAIHTDRVALWLKDLGLSDDDFRCGPQTPGDRDAREGLIRAGAQPCQIHNNCSGKHTGFLTLNKHIKGHADYELLEHPVQMMAKAAFEETTGETSPHWGVDGCSAPNHACTVTGLARSMAFFASAKSTGDLRQQSAVKLREAMMTYPELVAGETRACTELMRAMNHKVAIKTGAEGVFVAIIPALKMGVALKITDGATRASEAAIAAILVKLGVLDAAHPATIARMTPDMKNWRGIHVGHTRPAAALL